MYKKQKGFTLIEMIIVTVIIGILAGMVITVINIPRIQARSRDSRRIGDLKRIQSALELYFSNNRQYSESDTWTIFSNLILDEEYMNQVPADPRTENTGVTCFGPNSNNYGYWYRSNSPGTYVLGTIMELDTSAQDNLCSDLAECAGGYDCNHAGLCYCVTSPM